MRTISLDEFKGAIALLTGYPAEAFAEIHVAGGAITAITNPDMYTGERSVLTSLVRHPEPDESIQLPEDFDPDVPGEDFDASEEVTDDGSDH